MTPPSSTPPTPPRRPHPGSEGWTTSNPARCAECDHAVNFHPDGRACRSPRCACPGVEDPWVYTIDPPARPSRRSPSPNSRSLGPSRRSSNAKSGDAHCARPSPDGEHTAIHLVETEIDWRHSDPAGHVDSAQNATPGEAGPTVDIGLSVEVASRSSGRLRLAIAVHDPTTDTRTGPRASREGS